MGLKGDPEFRETCSGSGKARLTKSAAKSTAKRMAKTRKGENIQAYLCRMCGGWHVGGKRRFTDSR